MAAYGEHHTASDQTEATCGHNNLSLYCEHCIRLYRCHAALSGITNVEALGALLVKGKALADGWPHCDGSHGDCEMCDFRAAYRALYAPQASEAKPL